MNDGHRFRPDTDNSHHGIDALRPHRVSMDLFADPAKRQCCNGRRHKVIRVTCVKGIIP